MTVQDFAQILRTRWKLIAATVVIATLGGLAYTFLAHPQYQASTRLFVSAASGGNATQTNDAGLFAQRRVLSYIELLKGELLAQRTIDRLGLDMSAAQLQGEIEASSPTDTVLIDVDVLDSSPSRARDIANALADEFVVMAAGLETPELGAQPDARVIIQQRAEIPDSSPAPMTARNSAIAAILGALIGVILAITRDRLDNRVRSAETLEKVTGVGLLAEIPSEPHRQKEPLMAFDGDHRVTADAFREMRVNLQALEVNEGPRVLLVTSPLPDEGRTTTAINLSLALAESDHSVVVVDGDLREPRVASTFGLPAEVGLSTVLAGETSLEQALQETRFPRLVALTAGAVPADPAGMLGSRAAKDALSELSTRFDYVIVDTPPLMVKDAAILAGSSQGVLLVARFGHTRGKQLTSSVHAFRRAGAPVLGAVLAMAPAKKRSIAGERYRGAGHRHRGSGEK